MITFETLTEEEVLSVHNILVADFANSYDPISPSGVRDGGALISSAVARQHMGYGSIDKYNDPLQNAATLCYGICRNHGFHNGNKRTALVSMLCHLDKNNIVLKNDVKERALFELMLNIARGRFAVKGKGRPAPSDVEVVRITQWLKKNTRKIDTKERSVNFRQLKKILKEFNVTFEPSSPGKLDVIVTTHRTGFFRRKKISTKKVTNIPHLPDGREVGRRLLSNIRKQCNLTYKDGVDSKCFYGTMTEIDTFISKYQRALRDLAKT